MLEKSQKENGEFLKISYFGILGMTYIFHCLGSHAGVIYLSRRFVETAKRDDKNETSGDPYPFVRSAVVAIRARRVVQSSRASVLSLTVLLQ